MIFRKPRLLVDEMIKLEDTLSSSVLQEMGYIQNDYELAQRLGLQLTVVEDNELPLDTEAELRPSNGDHYGQIRVKKKYHNSAFACLHEIMHYVFDVGCGNPVLTTFARKTKGRTTDPHEQEINYLAAAYAMPYDKMVEAIREYDTASPRMDEFSFINDLCEKYNQQRVAVIRRIQEVRKISKQKKTKMF